MSTIEDFENAPIGATAKKEVGLMAIRNDDETDDHPWMCTTYGEWFSNEELAKRGYTLVPSAPTTAREALDLAWNLAHPVKEGQTITRGAEYLRKRSDRTAPTVYTSSSLDLITKTDEATIRTLDPLPDPEPDWLDAPAVIATCGCYDGARFVWEPAGGGIWVCSHGGPVHWTSLRDVNPLWPKGQDR